MTGSPALLSAVDDVAFTVRVYETRPTPSCRPCQRAAILANIFTFAVAYTLPRARCTQYTYAHIGARDRARRRAAASVHKLSESRRQHFRPRFLIRYPSAEWPRPTLSAISGLGFTPVGDSFLPPPRESGREKENERGSSRESREGSRKRSFETNDVPWNSLRCPIRFPSDSAFCTLCTFCTMCTFLLLLLPLSPLRGPIFGSPGPRWNFL